MQEEFNLINLWQMFKRHLLKIIGLTVLFALLAAALMHFFVQPKYQSNAQLIVNQQGNSDESAIQLNEIQTNVQLINTYQDIILADAVLDEVSERSQNIYSPAELRGAVSVNQTQNSQAFEIVVTLDNPENAQTVLNVLLEVFEETIAGIYESEEPNIHVISQASFNPNPVSPNILMYLILGAMIGFVLGLIWALVQELSDTTVKNADMLTDHGLINLGNISTISSKDIKDTRLSAQYRSERTGG
ncbi:LPS chain length-determining protein [Aerococcaceae bacterium DSM 111020]|nr:LPS chain length-determining protein [Aerococcaceae bacterium DSM 111020]